MGRLVQRVEREPAAGVADRVDVLAACHQQPDQTAERRAELARQRVGLVHVPGLELAAVAQRETLEQLAAEDLSGLGELLGPRIGRRE